MDGVTKYVRRRAAQWAYDLCEDVPDVHDVTVYETDPYEETGLVDHEGVPLYRMRETVKMGFHRG